jgi:hypothetical protein
VRFVQRFRGRTVPVSETTPVTGARPAVFPVTFTHRFMAAAPADVAAAAHGRKRVADNADRREDSAGHVMNILAAGERADQR